jgi:hypothetical protein
MKKVDMTKISKKSKTHAEVTNNPNDPMSLLISTIAQKFNLNSSEVESVVKEVMAQEHKDMEAQRQKDFTDRITQAVTDGKLTQAQADLITAKQTETKTFMENLKNTDEAARHTAMKSQMENFKQWAKDNNIPKEYFAHKGPGRPDFTDEMNHKFDPQK